LLDLLASKHFFSLFRVDYFAYPLKTSVAEQHHFYAAPDPVKKFDAAPTAAAPTLIYRITSQFFENKQKLIKGLGKRYKYEWEKEKKLLLYVTFLSIHLCLILILETEPPEPHQITAPAPPT
jgi:hypothetical protein